MLSRNGKAERSVIGFGVLTVLVRGSASHWAMRSLFILQTNDVRFIRRRAAAPFRPPELPSWSLQAPGGYGRAPLVRGRSLRGWISCESQTFTDKKASDWSYAIVPPLGPLIGGGLAGVLRRVIGK